MSLFEELQKRRIKCEICGGETVAIYGQGWDNDLIYCTDRDCGAEYSFPTSTYFESKEEHKMKANDILKKGVEIMDERAATYDAPEGERSMGVTVAMFNALTGLEMTENQGWKFMAILKMVRSEQGEDKLDNYLDGAAYFALAGESVSE